MDGHIKSVFLAVVLLAVVIAFSALSFAAPKKCNNGVDDDNDGLVDYPADPGCSSSGDNSETSASLVCDNGSDETNDRDTLADFRLSGGDPGCTSATDSSEIDGQCDDNLDSSDRDNLTDSSDPGCSSTSDSIETDGMCDDNVDDASDADALGDAADFGCSSTSDTSEVDAQCDDLSDNDGDTFTDYPNDVGCTSYSDNDETNPPQPQCSDSIDNDGDGKTDYGVNIALSDSKCSSASDNDESPRDNCSDTDGGIIAYTTGTVSGEDESVPFSNTDFCIDGTTLKEYYCGNLFTDYAPLSQNYNCNDGNKTICSAGRCQ